MAIATSRVNQRGYKTIYTVPAGKRAVVNVITHAINAFKMRLGISGSAVADYTAPAKLNYLTDSVGDITKRTALGNPGNDGQGAAWCVAMSKDGLWAVIGIPSRPSGTLQGRIEVWRYTAGSWVYLQELSGTVGGSDYFGTDVAISADGTYIAAASPSSNGSLSVRVFVRSSGSYSLQQAIPSVFSSNFETGTSIGYDKYLSFNDAGTLLAIGDPTFTTNTGRVHIYERSGTTWASKATIANPAASTGTYFGNSVHLSGTGDRIVIGRFGDAVTQAGSGAVVVMTTANGGTSWSVEQTIKSPTIGLNFQFGGCVGMDTDGTRIVVGEHNATNTNTGAGKAYVYSRSGATWTLEGTIAPTTTNSVYIGASVDMSPDGSHVIVGGPHTGAGSGAAAISQRVGTTWTTSPLFNETSGSNADNRFGWCVAIGNDPRGSLPVINNYGAITGIPAVQPVTWLVGVPYGDVYATNNGGIQFGSNYTSELTPRQTKATQIDTQIETDFATQIATLTPTLIDQQSITTKATWERTGLVLDAGESLIVASEDYTGDANVQVRGFVENV